MSLHFCASVDAFVARIARDLLRQARNASLLSGSTGLWAASSFQFKKENSASFVTNQSEYGASGVGIFIPCP
jgi:hypothetical protein